MMDWLFQRAELSPERPALIFRDELWTYAQLQERVSGLCAQLAELGIRANSRVALHLPNTPEFVMLAHALGRLGAVILPLNTRLTANETRYQLDSARAEWLMTGKATPPEIRALAPSAGLVLQSELNFEGSADRHWSSRSLDLGAPWGIMFTSGTTGRPKGAVLSYGNLFFSALASAHRLGLETAARWLLAMPLFHIGGLSILFRSMLYGTCVILHEKFDPSDIDRSLENGQASIVSLVPTMLQRLMETRDWQPFPESLKVVLLGGAAAPKSLLQRCIEIGIPLASTYGLTEAASQVATALPALVSRKPGTVGSALAGNEVRILSEAGAVLPAGEIGEIAVRGPIVSVGYLQSGRFPDISSHFSSGQPPLFPKDEKAIEAGLKHAGPSRAYPWFQTGDLGYLDEDGDLFVVQRRSDLIVTGGENVYPAEVEQALEVHPDVAQAFVYGLPDEEWGQRVAALVVPGRPDHIGAGGLLAHLREKLAGYKLPHNIEFVKSLPLTTSGKIDRQRAALMFAKKVKEP